MSEEEPQAPNPSEEPDGPDRPGHMVIHRMSAAAGPGALMGVGRLVPVVGNDDDVNLERMSEQMLAMHSAATVSLNVLMVEASAVSRKLAKVGSVGAMRLALLKQLLTLDRSMAELRKEIRASANDLLDLKRGRGKEIGAVNEARFTPSEVVNETVTTDVENIPTITIEAPQKTPKAAKPIVSRGTKLPYQFAPSKRLNPQFADEKPTGTSG